MYLKLRELQILRACVAKSKSTDSVQLCKAKRTDILPRSLINAKTRSGQSCERRRAMLHSMVCSYQRMKIR